MKGPAISFDKIDLYPVTNLCFRVICSYMPASDSLVTRIDVKIKNRQYSVALASTTPIAPKAGAPFNSEDDLITPSNGVIDCFNTKVSKNELITCLKELLTDLENDEKESENVKEV